MEEIKRRAPAPFSKFLETNRLILTIPDDSDLPHLIELQTNILVMQNIGGIRSREAILQSQEKAIKHYQQFGFAICCAFEKSTQQFVGRAGLIHLGYDFQHPEIELGYSIIPTFWQQGYAIELAKGLTAWAFKHLDIAYLVAVTRPHNTISQKVLAKCRFQHSSDTAYLGINVRKYQLNRQEWISI